MDRTVYTIEHRCSRCGGGARQTFAEEIRYGRLIWWESWDCAGCPLRTEGDGADRLTDELRNHVLAHEGSFRVDVHPLNRLGVMHALRDEFGMSMPDAVVVYKLLPHGFRTKLTHTEALVVASRFPAEVAETKIERE